VLSLFIVPVLYIVIKSFALRFKKHPQDRDGGGFVKVEEDAQRREAMVSFPDGDGHQR
jgi:hypothetical protein